MVRPSFRPDKKSFALRIAILRWKLVVDGKRPGRLALGFVDEIAVTTSKEDQRCGRLGSGRVADDTDDEDDMVAALVDRVGRAFEMSHSARDQRRFGMTDRRLHLVPFVGKRARELIGDLLLIAGEDVDGEALGFEHRREAARLAVDAEQDQRWIERYGIERTHGHADELVTPSTRGHHRNAGREFSQYTPECTVLHWTLPCCLSMSYNSQIAFWQSYLRM